MSRIWRMFASTLLMVEAKRSPHVSDHLSEKAMRRLLVISLLVLAGPAAAQSTVSPRLSLNGGASGGLGNAGYRPASSQSICLVKKRTGGRVCKTHDQWRRESQKIADKGAQ